MRRIIVTRQGNNTTGESHLTEIPYHRVVIGNWARDKNLTPQVSALHPSDESQLALLALWIRQACFVPGRIVLSPHIVRCSI